MKKLMVTVAAAVCAIGAYAADAWTADTENFNGYDVGPWTAPAGWSINGTPDDFDLQIVEKEAGNNFLQVETPKDGSLAKTINAAPAGYNVWVDAQVKFTPFDQAPAIDGDAKIAVWYLAQDAEGEEGQEGYVAGQTNLMVTAGYLTPSGIPGQKAVALATDFNAEDWHQLKIVSQGNILKEGSCLGFTIELDGEPVAAESSFTEACINLNDAAKNIAKNYLFPAASAETMTVSALALQGTGSIDDITIDATEVVVEVDVKLPESDKWYADSETTKAVPGAEIDLTLVAKDGYRFVGGEVEVAVKGTVETDGAVTITNEPETEAAVATIGENYFFTLEEAFETVSGVEQEELEIDIIADCQYGEDGFELKAEDVLVIMGTITVDKEGIKLATEETKLLVDGTLTECDFITSGVVGFKVDFDEEEATWKLIPDEEPVTYLAEINGTGYETLAAAYEKVEGGQTITLLADCEGNGISISKSITIDFNDFTYTVNFDPAGSTGTKSQAFQILQEAGEVTFKNGTITSTDVVKMLVNNYANLTLNGMTLDGTKMGVAHKVGTDTVVPNYTLSNNNGTTTLTGGTEIISKGAGHFAMDTYDAPKYAGVPTVVVNGATITGDVELTGGNLTLTAGTLNGALVAGSNIEKGTITKADAFVAAAPEDYEWDKEGKLVKKSEDPWQEAEKEISDVTEENKEAVEKTLETIKEALGDDEAAVSAWIATVYGGEKVPAATVAEAKNVAISVKYDLPLMTAETPTIEIKQAIDPETTEPIEGFTFQIKDGDDPVSLAAATEKIQSMVQFTADLKTAFGASEAKDVTVGLSEDKKTATATFTKATTAGFMKVELK